MFHLSTYLFHLPNQHFLFLSLYYMLLILSLILLLFHLLLIFVLNNQNFQQQKFLYILFYDLVIYHSIHELHLNPIYYNNK